MRRFISVSAGHSWPSCVQRLGAEGKQISQLCKEVKHVAAATPKLSDGAVCCHVGAGFDQHPLGKGLHTQKSSHLTEGKQMENKHYVKICIRFCTMFYRISLLYWSIPVRNLCIFFNYIHNLNPLYFYHPALNMRTVYKGI